MSRIKIDVLFNPASSGGRTGRQRAFIQAVLGRYLGRNYSFHLTRRPLEATSLAREAILAGSELIVAVGGDGTIQEAVNGFFAGGRPLNPACRLGIINAGTGHGFAQSLGFPADIESQCAQIAAGTTRPVDIGRVFYAGRNGSSDERYFVNECQAGIGSEVVKKVHAGNKKLGGTLAFGLATLAAAWTSPNRKMTVSVDGAPPITGSFLAVVCANGNAMAGGMHLAPGAKVDDGLLDILFMHAQSRSERLRNFPKIYSGSHLGSPKFTCFRGRFISLASEEEVALEADGELLGKMPCRIEILPSAIQVRARRAEKG
jgi:YegS/Rv2252/BmrU family lipid kinase